MLLLMTEIQHHLIHIYIYTCTILPEFLYFGHMRSISSHEGCLSSTVSEMYPAYMEVGSNYCSRNEGTILNGPLRNSDRNTGTHAIMNLRKFPHGNHSPLAGASPYLQSWLFLRIGGSFFMGGLVIGAL